jgi:hypothetical protein
MCKPPHGFWSLLKLQVSSVDCEMVVNAYLEFCLRVGKLTGDLLMSSGLCKTTASLDDL